MEILDKEKRRVVADATAESSQTQTHIMVLEAELVEFNFNKVSQAADSNELLNKLKTQDIENKVGSLKYKIIDFDNYMSGNMLIRE